MATPDIVEIEIVNWSKHQPRKDIKHPTWLALDNRIFEDPKLFDLSDEEWKAFFYILCQASQQNAQKAKINLRHAERVCLIKNKVMLSTISRLCDVGVTRTYGSRTDTSRDTTLQDTTEQNRTVHDTHDVAKSQSDLPRANPVPVYCEAYKARYGHNPEIGGKQAGILVRFAKDHSSSWEKLIRGYLAMPDSWAVARSHPVELLESKINEIKRFLETGKVVTKKVVEHAEELIDKAQGTNRKPRRSLEDLERERAAQISEPKLLPGESA